MQDANATAPNASRLLWAGFVAILATGIGFSIRGGILDNWSAEFGFTGAQIGEITGSGLTGFCFGIIIGGVIADRIGYGKLVIAAFLMHFLSAVVTLLAGGESAYSMLYWGMFLFAFANGTLEAVANPLVATLFPHRRTHYLNILHASWPLGLVLGAAIGWVLDDLYHVHWKIQLTLFLVATVGYGAMFLGQHMPKSEASAKGMKLADMFHDVGLLGALVICYLLFLFFSGAVGLPTGVSYAIAGALLLAVGFVTKWSLGSLVLFVLFVTHALVGAVELGTDGWIQNITGNLFSSEQGKFLFIWTSLIMFGLRFCAHWIERTLKLSPVGLLCCCAALACAGLYLSSTIETFAMAIIALAIYAVGKTFFWPTMLAVASDRFPRTGAVAISIMGGIGMMSGGLLGGPGLGYAKDRFAGEELQAKNPAAYAEYKAETASKFTIFEEAHGIDGKQFGAITEKLNAARADLAEAGQDPAGAIDKLTPAERAVYEASIVGDRRTLRADAWIPGTMAVIYLLLLVYFRSKGGYRVVKIEGD
ncbi:MAG: MFS transporter [Planctomycetes bacterium]|nr:MFS transporter [Planctomycetota bacterium]